MSNWIIEIALAVAFLIVLASSVYAYVRKFLDADDAERQALIAKATKELVEAAEKHYTSPKVGLAKFAWVMGKLEHRFPDVEWDELAGCVEAAVSHMNREKTMRTVRHRNGVHDA